MLVCKCTVFTLNIHDQMIHYLKYNTLEHLIHFMAHITMANLTFWCQVQHKWCLSVTKARVTTHTLKSVNTYHTLSHWDSEIWTVHFSDCHLSPCIHCHHLFCVAVVFALLFCSSVWGLPRRNELKMKSVSFIDTVVVQNDYSFYTIELHMHTFWLLILLMWQITNECVFACMCVQTAVCLCACQWGWLIAEDSSVWTNKVYLILN